MTELEQLQDYLDDLRANEEFLRAQERFLMGLKPANIKEEKWNEDRYYEELNRKHSKNYGNFSKNVW